MTTTPNLNAAFVPQPASSAIGNGTNLSSSFTTDKTGGARPPAAAWDVGAFEYISGGSAPVITSSASASATVGSSFTYNIIASNSPTSYNATGLPGGLSVNLGTGAITGIPTTSGSSNVAISAINAGGTGSATLALTVNSAIPPAPVITSAFTATATAGFRLLLLLHHRIKFAHELRRRRTAGRTLGQFFDRRY